MADLDPNSVHTPSRGMPALQKNKMRESHETSDLVNHSTASSEAPPKNVKNGWPNTMQTCTNRSTQKVRNQRAIYSLSLGVTDEMATLQRP